MNNMNKKIRTPRTQKDGWNRGVFTTKLRTSIYIDETLGKLLKKRSEESGSNMSRLINQSLNEYFGLVVR